MEQSPTSPEPPQHQPHHVPQPAMPQYEHVAQPQHHYAHNQHAQQVASAHLGSDRLEYSAARSIEYVFMTIALLMTAFSLALTLLLWTNGALTGQSAGIAVYPVAMLIISLPLFAGLLWDVKRAELHDPSLRKSVYRRISNQLVRVAAFTTCLFTLIGLVYGIFAHAAASTSSGGGSLGHVFGNTAILLVIAGGILAYYMRYEA